MRHHILAFALAALTTVVLSGAPALADNPGKPVGKAAETGANAVVNGSRTAGRTVRSFFKGGTSAAKSTAKENAAKTKSDAKRDAAATKAAGK